MLIHGTFQIGERFVISLEFDQRADAQCQVQFEGDLVGGGTVGRVPGQASQANGLQVLRDPHSHLPQKRGRSRRDCPENLRRVCPRKRRSTGQHFEHHGAEGENIRADADDYVMESLHQLEAELERNLNQVRNGIRTVEEEQARRAPSSTSTAAPSAEK